MVYLLLGILCILSTLFLRYKKLLIIMGILLFSIYFEVINISISPFGIEYNETNVMTLIIFISGLLLLVAELYVPDFGIIGIAGTILSSYALYLYVHNITKLLTLFFIILILSIVTILGYYSIGKKINISPLFILNDAITREAGYTSRNNYDHLENKRGIVTMDLRPVGHGEIDGHDYELISTGEYIDKGEAIKVVRIKNGSIYVTREDEANV